MWKFETYHKVRDRTNTPAARQGSTLLFRIQGGNSPSCSMFWSYGGIWRGVRVDPCLFPTHTTSLPPSHPPLTCRPPCFLSPYVSCALSPPSASLHFPPPSLFPPSLTVSNHCVAVSPPSIHLLRWRALKLNVCFHLSCSLLPTLVSSCFSVHLPECQGFSYLLVAPSLRIFVLTDAIPKGCKKNGENETLSGVEEVYHITRGAPRG